MNIVLLATHFSNEPEVRRFAAHLDALPRPAGMTVELAVADNSGDWDTGTALPDWMSVVRCPENYGYANGCEFAWQHARKRNAVDWVFVCNTDLTIADNFFESLQNLSARPDLGVLAPSVTRADGLAQNPHFRTRPTTSRMRAYLLAYRFGAALSLMEAASRWKQALRQTRSGHSSRAAICDHDESSDIYAAHGSMFGLSRMFFERGGRIGYESFLYGEEIHIAEQSRRLGLRVRFEPSLVVRHEAKAVTGQQHVSQRRRWKYDSMQYLFQTYFRTSPGRS